MMSFRILCNKKQIQKRKKLIRTLKTEERNMKTVGDKSLIEARKTITENNNEDELSSTKMSRKMRHRRLRLNRIWAVISYFSLAVVIQLADSDQVRLY